jgi:hypothetical protein
MSKQGSYIKNIFERKSFIVVWVYSSGFWVTPAGVAWAHIDGLKSLLHFYTQPIPSEQIIIRTHFSCPALIDLD